VSVDFAFQDQDYLLPYIVLAETQAQVTAWAEQEGIKPERCTWAALPAALEIPVAQIVKLPKWHRVPEEDRLPIEAHLDEMNPRWRP
jgi:hypothetical protein